MDKDKCVAYLNSFRKSGNIVYIKPLMDYYLRNNNTPNKEEYINIILGIPMLNSQVIHYVINELCREFKINSITDKNNSLILFY